MLCAPNASAARANMTRVIEFNMNIYSSLCAVFPARRDNLLLPPPRLRGTLWDELLSLQHSFGAA